jgi:hypothetical protein
VLELTPAQYMSILQDRSRHHPRLQASLRKMLANTDFGRYWNETFSPNAGQPWVGPVAQSANDVLAITRTLNALGMAGIMTYTKSTATGSYIIIKGYAAHRSAALQGTRYLASHPRMLQLGLGMQGLQGVAKGGFVLGLVVSAGIEVTDFIFNDEKTMFDLLGGIGVEAVKGGLAGLLAYAFAAGIAVVTTVAVSPLLIMAVVAVVAGIGLNNLDAQLGLKSKVVQALQSIPAGVEKGAYYIDTASRNWLESVRSQIQEVKIRAGQSLDEAVQSWLCRVPCRWR